MKFLVVFTVFFLALVWHVVKDLDARVQVLEGHFVESAVDPESGGAAKSYPEWPYATDWLSLFFS